MQIYSTCERSRIQTIEKGWNMRILCALAGDVFSVITSTY